MEKYTNMRTNCKLSRSIKINYLNNPDWQRISTVHDLRVRRLDRSVMQLDTYLNCVCIFVNTASNCITAKYQFDQLNKLYKDYKDTKGLRVLAFPCNQFGNSEPGDASEIEEVYKNLGVQFDVTEKVNVNCDESNFVWKYMKSLPFRPGQTPESNRNLVKWNFEKFIIDRTGVPVARFSSSVMPNDMLKKLEEIW